MAESFSAERRRPMCFLGEGGFDPGGTLNGVGRVFAEHRPDTKTVVCESEGAAMLTSGVAQDRNRDGSPASGHPAFEHYPMQGWNPHFIPKITEDALNKGYIHELIKIAGPEAMECSRNLAQKEGVFVGISAGAAFAGALKVCERAPAGSTVLCMLPDTAERHLSTPLFADIEAEMSDAEMEIPHSTPGYHRLNPA